MNSTTSRNRSNAPRSRRGMLVVGIISGCLIGLCAGLGAYTFVYAKGASYLTNDPNACANCHVMNKELDGWIKGPHRHVAVCNDCHTPHDLLGKYTTKALNGWHHSVAFTTGNFHEPITITERNKRITEQACRRCHQAIVQEIDTHSGVDEPLDCIRCHAGVGH